MPRTWFITGATRGLGRAIAEAALAHGDAVVATGRDPSALADLAATAGDKLLAPKLDVTRPAEIDAAVAAALARFGGIDILVNNAGYGQLGLFEEVGPEAVRRQFDVNVFGLMDVTRAVLPAMRAARRGHIFNITSIAGLRGGLGGGVYCASKHAVEGLSESLAQEVAPFGIALTIVEPGFFRTDFLDETSVGRPDRPIADYAETAAQQAAFYAARNHNQAGDPARLAGALLVLADAERPPLRFVAGSDALAVLDAKVANLTEVAAPWRDLSRSTDGSF
jgi:NAD(P)-dependent dehydrogenase (short-subunit alcohol dehydrogenase family)